MKINLFSYTDEELYDLKRLIINKFDIKDRMINNMYNRYYPDISNIINDDIEELCKDKVEYIFNNISQEEILIGSESYISIDKLNGIPGVLTPNYGVEKIIESSIYNNGNHDNDILIKLQNMKKEILNMEMLLNSMEGLKDSDRNGILTTVLVLKSVEDEIKITKNIDIRITESPRGGYGYGYDPILEYRDLNNNQSKYVGKTLAELEDTERDKLTPISLCINELYDMYEKRK